jgi:ABC-type methionine transport system permease subunit
MPKTKTQGFIFGLIMSYAMAYGMEVYNVAIKEGYNLNIGGFSTMTNNVFLDALIEASYMGLIVELFSSLFGNKLGAAIAATHMDSIKDNPYLCQLMRQACTVMIMCPAMSLAASILFNVILAHASIVNLAAIWVGTLIKNFPMAFFWNMFAAAPFTRWAFRKLFPQKG